MDDTGGGRWDEVVRARELLDLLPHGIFDPLAALLARLARTDHAAVAFVDGGRLTSRGVAGDVPSRWPAAAGPGMPCIGRHEIALEDGGVVGEVSVFDDHGRVLSESGMTALSVVAAQAAEWVQHTLDATEHRADHGVAVLDATGTVLAASAGLERLLGVDSTAIVGASGLDLVHPDDLSRAAIALADTITFGGDKAPLDIRLVRPDGAECAVELVAENRLHHPIASGIVLTVRTTDGRAPVDAMLAAQLRVLEMVAADGDIEPVLDEVVSLLEHLVPASRVVVMVVDHPTRRLTPAAAPTVGRDLLERLATVPSDDRAVPCSVAATRRQRVQLADLAGEPIAAGIAAAARVEGIRSCASFPVLSTADRLPLATIDVYRTESGSLRPNDIRIIELACHLTALALERRAAREHLAHQAAHDSLTDLPNRAHFNERLEVALSRLGPDRCIAVLFCDVDNFKVINDAFGHETGDAILASLAQRIGDALRSREMACRLGGDEFAVLVDPVDGAESALSVAQRLLVAAAKPFHVYGRELYVTMSIGIALGESGRSAPDRLLLEADVAMYEAKAMGKDSCAVFREQLLDGMLERVELEAALRRAIDRDELVLHYQPKLAAGTHELLGVEALVRWQRNGSLVPPGDFIGVAEASGLIAPIGKWVLDRACEQAATWMRRWPHRELSLSVNVSTRQLDRGDLVTTVADALERSGLPAHCLVLEITESALEETRYPTAGSTLHALKQLGVQLSIDDFGTGYSSLGRLRSLDLDELKIDRSFVAEITSPDAEVPLVVAIVAMAHGLGRRIVAEGVETDAQVALLERLGCDILQGYLLGRPVSAEDLEPALASAVHGQALIARRA